jgi:hypothetical protein
MLENVDLGTQAADFGLMLEVHLLEFGNVIPVCLFVILDVFSLPEPIRDFSPHSQILFFGNGETTAEPFNLGFEIFVLLFERMHALFELGPVFAELLKVSFVLLHIFLEVFVLRIRLISLLSRMSFLNW